MHRIYASQQAELANAVLSTSGSYAAVQHVKDVLHLFGEDREFRIQFIQALTPDIIVNFKKITGADLIIH